LSVRVSVVMPVHNAGGYLRAAIESVLAQTMPDFELVLVDDGSTDGSGAVCDEFASRDRRVRVVRQANAGICRARNVGMEASTGEWLAFCDHDDLYMPQFLELALACAEATGCRLVKVGRTVELRYADGRTEPVSPSCSMDTPDGPVDVPALRTVRDFMRFKFISTYVWDGLYSKELVARTAKSFDERFKAGGEDIDFMLRLLAGAKRVGWVGRRLYRHFENIGVSTSVRYMPNRVEAAVWNAELMARMYPADGAAAAARIDDRIKSLFHYSFEHPDCPLSLSEKADVLRRVFGALAPEGVRVEGGGRLLWIAARGWFRTYIVLKLLARKARALLRIVRRARSRTSS